MRRRHEKNPTSQPIDAGSSWRRARQREMRLSGVLLALAVLLAGVALLAAFSCNPDRRRPELATLAGALAAGALVLRTQALTRDAERARVEDRAPQLVDLYGAGALPDLLRQRSDLYRPVVWTDAATDHPHYRSETTDDRALWIVNWVRDRTHGPDWRDVRAAWPRMHTKVAGDARKVIWARRDIDGQQVVALSVPLQNVGETTGRIRAADRSRVTGVPPDWKVLGLRTSQPRVAPKAVVRVELVLQATKPKAAVLHQLHIPIAVQSLSGATLQHGILELTNGRTANSSTWSVSELRLGDLAGSPVDPAAPKPDRLDMRLLVRLQRDLERASGPAPRAHSLIGPTRPPEDQRDTKPARPTRTADPDGPRVCTILSRCQRLVRRAASRHRKYEP